MATDASDKIDVFKDGIGLKTTQNTIKPPADEQSLVAIGKTEAVTAPCHSPLQFPGLHRLIIQREPTIGGLAPVFRPADETVDFDRPATGQPCVGMEKKKPVAR